MRHRLDVGFKEPELVDEQRYRIISFNYLGDCPLQKNGLCEIHRNFGEDNLPKICRLYPRSLKKVNNQRVGCCSSSCERVVELLMEKGFTLKEIELDEKESLSYSVDEDILNRIKHDASIINNKANSLANNIKKVCLEVNKEEFIKDYNCDINPVSEGLYILNRLKNDNFLGEIIEEVTNRYTDNYYQYEIDKDNFEILFPDWMIYFENVINNSLLYENFPFVDNRFNKTLAYKGLCASYGLLRLLCVGYCASHNKKDDLVDCIAALFHLIDHTAFYYNINVLAKSSALLLKL